MIPEKKEKLPSYTYLYPVLMVIIFGIIIVSRYWNDSKNIFFNNLGLQTFLEQMLIILAVIPIVVIIFKSKSRSDWKEAKKEIPSIIKQKAKEKISTGKDALGVYFAIVDLLLVFGLAVALFVWENPEINIIPDASMPFLEKTVVFIALAIVALLLFFYNKKFFSKAARDTNWVWKWKK